MSFLYRWWYGPGEVEVASAPAAAVVHRNPLRSHPVTATDLQIARTRLRPVPTHVPARYVPSEHELWIAAIRMKIRRMYFRLF